MALEVLSCHSSLLMLLLVLAERVEIIMAIIKQENEDSDSGDGDVLLGYF